MTPSSRQPCTGRDLDRRGEVSLPVLREHAPRGAIRRSRSGRRRAVVLAAVQLLMVAHVALWALSARYGWWGGRTTTPIEPSESMEFVKNGVVNAGLVFFAVALLATLVLGRWFCGWGCHLVMLQDLCGWIMKKAGVRPRAFRSRLLIYVPLILALYMFVWPAFYRLAVAPWVRPDLTWPGVSMHLTTTDFWKTFPGVLVAVPFLLICGFGCVYFLGAKGFCTYGCPYGGFFAPLDEFAAGRIRVTDACEQCGHCTAVCTSNVRVHEEVREYGMVVDQGCMKCLDCVSVCPNDALYFGFGRPAAAKGAARHAAPRRVYDLTWPQEIALSLVFLGAFLGVRGVYGLIPMLMAAGIAGVVTFLAWMLWRLIREPDVRFHRYQLRRGGRLRPAGAVFAALAAASLLLTAHCGAVNALAHAGSLAARRALNDPHAGPAAIDRAVLLSRLASSIADGGIGLAGNPRIDLRLARLYGLTGDLGGAERSLRRALAADPDNLLIIRQLSLVLMDAGDVTGAVALARRSVELDPDNPLAHAALAFALGEAGDAPGAIAAMRRAVALAPDDANLRESLARLEATAPPASPPP